MTRVGTAEAAACQGPGAALTNPALTREQPCFLHTRLQPAAGVTQELHEQAVHDWWHGHGGMPFGS